MAAAGLESWLRGFFLVSAAAILFASRLRALRARYLAYGPRSATATSTSSGFLLHHDGGQEPYGSVVQHTISKGLDQLASAQVPHSWFKHFYILSMLLSAFWAAQFLSQGTVYRWFVVQANTNGTPAGNMSLEQILLAWGLMSMHACRRLYECIAFAKSSSSRMWIAHWLLGLTFYTAASMAIWVEGIPALRTSEISWKAFPLGPPSARTLLCIPLFLLSSGLQFICHYHLSSLKKYSLPTHPAFQILICPHYTAECLIYLSLAVMAAPRGSLINVTLLTTLILVLVNLGITSDMTREFYIRKFKDDTIRNRWRMIPLLF